MAGARIFGILSGSEDGPRVAYLKPGVRVSQRMLAKLGAIEPTQVFRFAAVCEKARCTHFDGEQCQLGKRVAQQIEPVVDELPPCQIRATCRWFAEQGRAVCLRCPQIATRVPGADLLARIAVTPHPPSTMKSDSEARSGGSRRPASTELMP